VFVLRLLVLLELRDVLPVDVVVYSGGVCCCCCSDAAAMLCVKKDVCGEWVLLVYRLLLAVDDGIDDVCKPAVVFNSFNIRWVSAINKPNGDDSN
jgi:hypothetical protein